MSSDEAAALLVEKLLLFKVLEESHAADCQRILADALAASDALPDSWFDVSDRVTAFAKAARGELASRPSDLTRLGEALNQALLNHVHFPRAIMG